MSSLTDANLTPIELATFSTFKSCKATEPTKPITAKQLIDSVIGDRFEDQCNAIRSAPDKATRSKLKAALPAVTASGTFSKRGVSALLKHSGLLIADIDLSDNAHLTSQKRLADVRFDLCAAAHTAFVFSSPSGGLKVGVCVHATDAQDHKIAFRSVKDWMLNEFGLRTDDSCSDVSRLCYLSHDSQAFYNKFATPLPNIEAAEVAEPAPMVHVKATGGTNTVQPGTNVDQVELTRAALMCIPTRPDRDEWLKVIAGVVDSVGESAALGMLCEWSPEEEAGEYLKAFQSGLKQVGAGTLFSMAQDNGFDHSTAAREIRRESVAGIVDVSALLANSERDDLDAATGDKNFLDVVDGMAASTLENIAEMKLRAQDAVFVLPGIAMLGDCTILNAGPNTGKTLMTLWLLSQRDKEATDHLHIYYINADDSFNGGIEKMEALQGEGITTLIPNQSGFKSEQLAKIIEGAIKADVCSKMVIILDTLKKFVSTMDKNDARVFNIMVRSFTQAGGTFIALAHTNKNKDADGKSIAEGVGDFQSDFDCAYTIERAPAITEGAMRTIVFENTKLRGPNSMKVTYKYDAGEKKSWLRRFQSIEHVGAEEAKAAEAQALAEAQADRDKWIIDYVSSQLAEGPKPRTALTQNDLGGDTGSRGQREKVLIRYTDTLWGASKGQTGGLNYYLIDKELKPLPWAQ